MCLCVLFEIVDCVCGGVVVEYFETDIMTHTHTHTHIYSISCGISHTKKHIDNNIKHRTYTFILTHTHTHARTDPILSHYYYTR